MHGSVHLTFPRASCPVLSPVALTLFKLRAALSFPPGVRFRSCTSSRLTSWTMADTEYAMSPAYRWFLVCSASSRAMLAAISPDFICRGESRGKGRPRLSVRRHSSAFQPRSIKQVNSAQEEEEKRWRRREGRRNRSISQEVSYNKSVHGLIMNSFLTMVFLVSHAGFNNFFSLRTVFYGISMLRRALISLFHWFTTPLEKNKPCK